MISFYTSKKEKNDAFEIIEYIDDSEQLKDFLESIDEMSADYIFRGVGKGSYKIYSSAQRLWLSNNMPNSEEQYFDFIKSIVQNAREEQNGVLEEYLKNFNAHKLDWATLGFVQHFGGATPFIDFTEELKIALYFGAIDSNFYVISDNELDNYFSIYLIPETTVQILDSPIEKALMDNAVITVPTETRDAILKSVDLLKVLPATIIREKGRDRSSKLYNNFRIINQAGLFVCSNSPDKPLEVHLKNTIEIYDQDVAGKLVGCINIHKKFAAKILKFLKKNYDIDREYMFPDGEELARKAVLKYFENIN